MFVFVIYVADKFGFGPAAMMLVAFMIMTAVMLSKKKGGNKKC